MSFEICASTPAELRDAKAKNANSPTRSASNRGVGSGAGGIAWREENTSNRDGRERAECLRQNKRRDVRWRDPRESVR